MVSLPIRDHLLDSRSQCAVRAPASPTRQRSRKSTRGCSYPLLEGQGVGDLIVEPIKRVIRPLALRIGWITQPEPEPEGVEKSSDYYDEIYANSEEYQLDYYHSRYYFLWTVIADRIRQSGLDEVLEIGCGSGQLACLLLDQGVKRYTGLDFSATAIEMARRRSPEATFLVDDARTSDVYVRCDYNVVVCTEVLEHVEADLRIVSNFRPGVRCICLVPSFPDVSHVRHFENAAQVKTRYGPWFSDFDVLTFRMPAKEEPFYYFFDGIRNNRHFVQGR